jgi:ABC-2 type transport system permease protein
MELRSREMRLRLLDKARIRDEKVFWQLVNVTGPVLLEYYCRSDWFFHQKRIYTREG